MHVDRNLLVQIFTHYSLGEVIDFKSMKKGVANKLFKVTTTYGTYILKIAIRNSEAGRVAYEVELLNKLENLPSPKPIVNRDGTYLVDIDTYKAFLYPYLPGDPPEAVTDNMTIQSALALARLHLQLKNFVPAKTTNRIRLWDIPAYYPLAKLRSAIGKVKNTEIQAGATYASDHIEKYIIDTSSLPQGCLHGDFKPENLLFSGEELTGIVDFDNSYIEALAFEVGYALAWFCRTDKKFNLKRAKLFLENYQNVRPLTQAEKESLYPQIQFLYMAMILVNTYWLFDEKLPLPEEFTLWNVRAFIPSFEDLLGKEQEFYNILSAAQ